MSVNNYSNNTNGASSAPTLTPFDRVVMDLKADQKARVLELVLRLDIQVDDPLWLIAIALGQLQVIVEDAPQDWQSLFDVHKQELEAWTATNLKTLELVAEKGAVMQQLAETSKRLSDALQLLVTACNTLTQRLNTSEATSQALSTTVNSLSNQLQIGLDSLNSQLTQQNSHVNQRLVTLDNGVNGARRAGSGWMWVALLSLSGVLFLGWQQYRLQQQVAILTQQSEWQLANVINMACTFGAKPPESPECQ
ncbi:hypothetical protein N836_00145 [Leptolyngbya sp. Heron Island J]|uniref:DUF6753 family protein n=1 Tax=Leptolyngbya sp. Heron Island J TaxID=1385935 RepID=UPI0003B956E9|nr:DUF6753 family protein [Leptolyngbya sp. Heron Island J]ESA37124.1 hypothetical protein N836_00145 [Leptolyngbya sp. Heron Island J]